MAHDPAVHEARDRLPQRDRSAWPRQSRARRGSWAAGRDRARRGVGQRLDGALARRALEAERSFTANSAHELRTPIAAALAQTQRLIAELPESPASDRARSIATALRRLSRLSEKLLQLAKAEGGGLLAETPAPLGLVLRHVIEEIDRQTDRGDALAVSITPDGGPLSDLDPDAFAILARNLIENALKHGAPRCARLGAARRGAVRGFKSRRRRAGGTAGAARPAVRARPDAVGGVRPWPCDRRRHLPRCGPRVRPRLADPRRSRWPARHSALRHASAASLTGS
ncbi:protein of unknown function (plasmid) [Methylocella tundrae]|uniref:histidine kinase n=1 Tax=Methylocella tundrae TaxID=227605 RepID=A0A4U8Z949_METTU|nr:protein of unknown function [Methylocella tundrae]